jgi:hypothetical protein
LSTRAGALKQQIKPRRSGLLLQRGFPIRRLAALLANDALKIHDTPA